MSDQLEGLTLVTMDPETNPVSHSQYSEDLRALVILKRWNITSGRILEIGAWHPISLSNSRMFIEAGWRAVLVEPSPTKLEDLAREYFDNERVQVVCAAIQPVDGWVMLNLSQDALSGESIPKQWKEKGGFYGRAWYPGVSFPSLIARTGGDFQVVSIDTEGTSVELFASMLQTGMRPRVVIVEHDGRAVEVNQIAEAAHYRQECINGTNVIFEWTGAKEG